LITTAQLAKELRTNQRNIQNRITRLLALRIINNVQRVGNAFVLTQRQADAVRDYQHSNQSKENADDK